jgi:hypothetical protein
LCGWAGLVDDDPAEEDDDFELDLEAVDVVSFGPPVVFMGFETLVFEFIPVLTVVKRLIVLSIDAVRCAIINFDASSLKTIEQ